MLGTILLIILILLLIGALPTWPYSGGWGYYPSSGLGLVLVIIIVLLLLALILIREHRFEFAGLTLTLLVILYIPLIWIGLAIGAKRLHDRDCRSRRLRAGRSEMPHWREATKKQNREQPAPRRTKAAAMPDAPVGGMKTRLRIIAGILGTQAFGVLHCFKEAGAANSHHHAPQRHS